jgi:hypothetical protein
MDEILADPRLASGQPLRAGRHLGYAVDLPVNNLVQQTLRPPVRPYLAACLPFALGAWAAAAARSDESFVSLRVRQHSEAPLGSRRLLEMTYWTTEVRTSSLGTTLVNATHVMETCGSALTNLQCMAVLHLLAGSKIRVVFVMLGVLASWGDLPDHHLFISSHRIRSCAGPGRQKLLLVVHTQPARAGRDASPFIRCVGGSSRGCQH